MRALISSGSALSGCLLAALALMSGSAWAQGAPFIDRSFTTVSADNDPDLIVVREAYDPITRRQSIYLRVHAAGEERQRFSGLLKLEGARLVEVIYTDQALRDSDAIWGIEGVQYGAENRGLEGPNPTVHVPIAGGDDDYVRGVGARTGRFWFSNTSDIDDARFIIQHPPEPGPARFSIELFGPNREDPMGFPTTRQGGIQVGSLVDQVPDDGDYSEVFGVRNIKLRVEDLDIIEDGIFIGETDFGGSQLGPASFRVDNFSGADDADQDNGFDQNGLISPIPSASSLDHLTLEIAPLLSEAGASIPVNAIRVEGFPIALQDREFATVEVFATPPANAPAGTYRGLFTAFEDNNEDGIRDRGEPADSVRVTLVVGIGPDGGIVDLGPPPQPDASPARDAFIDLDDGVPTDAGDLEDGDVRGDGDVQGDGDVGGDGAARGDGEPSFDFEVDPKDSGDRGPLRDGERGDAQGADGGPNQDGGDGSARDGARRSDGGRDGGDGFVNDGFRRRDGTGRGDGPGADGGADGSTRPNLGRARGGAFSCDSTGDGGTLLLVLLLAPLLLGRRRR